MSIRIDLLKSVSFEFPEKMILEKKLKDILDDEVDEKYYLSEKQTKRLQNSSFNSQKARENDPESTVGTLCARDYKGQQCVRLGGLYDKNGKTHQAGSIYEVGGVAPTLSTMQGGNLEPMIVASRGRNVMGTDKTEQHLEPNTSGTTNTITSVAKDNYVAEPIGGGIAVKTANKKGYDMAKDGDPVDLAYPNSTTRRGRVGHEVSKTLECGDTMAVVVDSSVKPSVAKNFEREKEQIATTDKEIYQCKCETAWQDNKVGCKVSPSLRSGNNSTYGLTSNYRIRKLTPKECWRLMGFDDSDFEKAEKVNSNTQLYKQAGNSIVVNVLEGILRNLLQNGRC